MRYNFANDVLLEALDGNELGHAAILHLFSQAGLIPRSLLRKTTSSLADDEFASALLRQGAK